MGWKINVNVYFSKQMLLFHLFLPFILWYVKKLLNIQNISAIPVFMKIRFECYNLLIDLVP